MSAFGGKADMAFCGISLSWSLLGVKRTLRFALQMSAFDPKRTWGQFHIGLGSTSMAKPGSWILVGIMEGGDVSPPCAPSLCANQQRGGIDGHQDRVAGT